MFKKIAGTIIALILIFPAVVSAQIPQACVGITDPIQLRICLNANGPGTASGFLGNLLQFSLPSGTITGIVTNIVYWILVLFSFIGIIGFCIAGIIYLTSAGDEDLIEKAKRAMLYSIIGVIVGLLGFVILQAVSNMLSGASSTF